MGIRATRTTKEGLRRLPTPARPVVDAGDVRVSDWYEVEAVPVGLTMPTGMKAAEDGTLFVLEGEATWPTRPEPSPRVLRMDPSGHLEVFAEESFGGPRRIDVRGNEIFVSLKDGHYTRIVKYDLTTRESTVLVDRLPEGGWHEAGGPVFGLAGLMYFGQGPVSLNGVVEPQGLTVDAAKHPGTHDVPGQDVKLTGNNVWSDNRTASYPYPAETAPSSPTGCPPGRARS